MLRRFGSTIGQALGHDGFRYDPTRIAYFKSLCYSRFSTLLSGKLEHDTVNVFVKQEPHKQEKLDNERYRLISGVSVVDTMIDRILFGPLARQVLGTVGCTPCMAGWTPVQGGYRLINALFDGDEVMSLDKKGWDWSVSRWIVEQWLMFVINLAVAPPQWWIDLVILRFRALFVECIFEFQDGLQVKQPGIGIMKSGCFLTIILNSVGQSMCHYIVNRRLKRPMQEDEPIAMGDDTTQKKPPNVEAYIRELRRLGVHPKEPKITPWIEFAGFVIHNGVCWPAYWRKHLYALKHVKDEFLAETLESYQTIYAHEPLMLAILQYNIRTLCPRVYTPVALLRRQFDG